MSKESIKGVLKSAPEGGMCPRMLIATEAIKNNGMLYTYLRDMVDSGEIHACRVVARSNGGIPTKYYKLGPPPIEVDDDFGGDPFMGRKRKVLLYKGVPVAPIDRALAAMMGISP